MFVLGELLIWLRGKSKGKLKEKHLSKEKNRDGQQLKKVIIKAYELKNQRQDL